MIKMGNSNVSISIAMNTMLLDMVNTRADGKIQHVRQKVASCTRRWASSLFKRI